MINKKKLWNKTHIRKIQRFSKDVKNTIIKSGKVTLHSHVRGIKKYLKVILFQPNPTHKSYLLVDLNKLSRLNYPDGSVEMYRQVNGLCVYCGNKDFTGDIAFSSNGGYIISNIECTHCRRKTGFHIVDHPKLVNSTNRGKRYAERKKKLNKKQKDESKKTRIKISNRLSKVKSHQETKKFR